MKPKRSTKDTAACGVQQFVAKILPRSAEIRSLEKQAWQGSDASRELDSDDIPLYLSGLVALRNEATSVWGFASLMGLRTGSLGR